jgi:hypothetical protein
MTFGTSRSSERMKTLKFACVSKKDMRGAVNQIRPLVRCEPTL